MAKKKETATTIADRDELEQVMGEYASEEIERQRLVLAMEAELNEVRQRYEEAIADRSATCAGLFEDIQAWAVLNPDAFRDRKSLALLHGTIGFRTSPPAVKQVPGVKAEHTVSRLVAQGFTDYYRTKTEIDKDAILADFSARKTDNAMLAAYGLRVEQKENFYAEVRHEEVNS